MDAKTQRIKELFGLSAASLNTSSSSSSSSTARLFLPSSSSSSSSTPALPFFNGTIREDDDEFYDNILCDLFAKCCKLSNEKMKQNMKEKLERTRQQLSLKRQEDVIEQCKKNAKNRVYFDPNLKAACIEAFLTLKDYVNVRDRNKDYKQQAVEYLRTIDSYTVEDLEQLSFVAGDFLQPDGRTLHFPPCALGNKCIGQTGCVKRYSTPSDSVTFMARLPKSQLQKVVFGGEKTEPWRLCVVDEWLAFERFILSLRALGDKMDIEAYSYVDLYNVVEGRSSGSSSLGFHSNSMIHPSSRYEGFLRPFPQFDCTKVRLVVDPVLKLLRCDFARMTVNPDALVDAQLYSPVKRLKTSKPTLSDDASSSSSLSSASLSSFLEAFSCSSLSSSSLSSLSTSSLSSSSFSSASLSSFASPSTSSSSSLASKTRTVTRIVQNF